MGSLATALDDFSASGGAPPNGDASADGAAVNPGPSAPAGLAGLKSKRHALRAESERLGIAATRLDAANEAQRAAVAACDASIALDSARMIEWASSGAVGDAPQPDRAQHDKLAAALARAAQAATSARGAATGIGERQVEIAGEMRVVDAQIEGMALDALTAEHAQAVVLANRATARAAGLIGEAHSFKLFLIEMARRKQMSGDHDGMIALYRRVEKLESPLPLLGLDDVRMKGIVADWAGQFEEMTGDA